MTDHDKAIALELTRLHFEILASKNVPPEKIGYVLDVYLDMLEAITSTDNPCSPDVLAIAASNAGEMNPPF